MRSIYLFLLLVAVSVTPILAGCGDKAAETSSDSGAATATAPSAAPPEAQSAIQAQRQRESAARSQNAPPAKP